MAAWCAVYTDAQCEERARVALGELAYDVFLPVERYFSRRLREIRERPLFSRYLFVGIAPEQPYGPIKAAKGVRQLLTYTGADGGQKPLLVKPALIEELRRAESVGVFDLTPTRLKQGDRVRVEGPLSDWIGCIKSASDKRRVEVLFAIMGREVVVSAPLGAIERV